MKMRYAIILWLLALQTVHNVRAADTIRNIDGIMSVNMMDAAPPGVPFDITAYVIHPEKVGHGYDSIYIKDDSGSTALQNCLAATNAPLCFRRLYKPL